MDDPRTPEQTAPEQTAPGAAPGTVEATVPAQVAPALVEQTAPNAVRGGDVDIAWSPARVKAAMAVVHAHLSPARVKALAHEYRADFVAGSVVFLVALPLCLGIAVASGAPPMAGIIAGIIGGLVVPLISRSPLSVSGPAAGLTAIAAAGAVDLGSYAAFATAVFLGGVFQALLGVARAGVLAAIVPASVIKAMLSAIGVIIIVKQFGPLLGVPEAMISIDALVLSADRFGNIGQLIGVAHPGSFVVAAVSIAILSLWRRLPASPLAWVPSSLVVVVVGTLLSFVFASLVPALALPTEQLIQLPSLFGDASGGAGTSTADFSALRRSQTWTVGATIALVASIETLLSCEALDRIDPHHRRTPKNRELVAQGVANALSGLLGGLPITAVIVRSTTNIQAGARSRVSAVVHGALLLVAVVALAPLLNHVPVACLAAILLHVGLRLAAPRVLQNELRLGPETWVPFVVTLVSVVLTDLLRGVTFGFLVSMLVVLKHATRDTVVMKREGNVVHVDFLRDATFLVKPALVAILDDVQPGETVVIDCEHEMIDPDVREVLATFAADAPNRGIEVEIRGLDVGEAPSAPTH